MQPTTNTTTSTNNNQHLSTKITSIFNEYMMDILHKYNDKIIAEFPNSQINMEDLHQLMTSFNLEDDNQITNNNTKPNSLSKKEKKTKKENNRKMPDDEERCIALTKGNERCKASRCKAKGGLGKYLCSLHFNGSGKIYGVLENYTEEYNKFKETNNDEIYMLGKNNTETHKEITFQFNEADE